MIAIVRSSKTPRSREASTEPDERSALLQHPGDEITYETLPDQEHGSIRHSSLDNNMRSQDEAVEDLESSAGSDTLIDTGARLYAVRNNMKSALRTTVATSKQAPATAGKAVRHTTSFIFTWTWRVLIMVTCLTLIYGLPVLAHRFLIKNFILYLQICISKKDLLAGERLSELLGAAMQAFFAVMLYLLWCQEKAKSEKHQKGFAALVREALSIALGMEAGFETAYLVTVVVIWGWKAIEIGAGHGK